MGRNGSCDFRDWERLKENLDATDEQLREIKATLELMVIEHEMARRDY